MKLDADLDQASHRTGGASRRPRNISCTCLFALGYAMAVALMGTVAVLFPLRTPAAAVLAVLIVGAPILGFFPFLVLAAFDEGGWGRAREMLQTELRWIAAVILVGIVLVGAVLLRGRGAG